MRLFSHTGNKKKSLFNDKSVLTPLHLLEDDEIVDREKEMKIIADYIKRVLAGLSSKILFIYGSSGLGKTSITRYVLSKLQVEGIEEALPIYINCLDKRTKHSILTELMRFFRAFYDGKGRSSDEILEDFKNEVKKEDKVPIIVLDNFDRLSDLESLLWSLMDLRSYFHCGIILISTGKFDLSSKLGFRIKSILNVEELYFSSYNKELIFQIMKARVKSAFSVKVADKALKLIAEYIEQKDSNMKIAFNILINAGELAEWTNSNSIEEKRVKKAIEELEKINLLEKIREMERKGGKELEVLKCIMELKGKKIDSGSLFEYMKKRGIRMSRRSFVNYINYLEKEGFIKTRSIVKGRGRSREIELKTEKKMMLEGTI